MSISREQADREWEADLGIRPEPVEYWSDIAARDPAWCMSSPDGTGPHVLDRDNCAECGAAVNVETFALTLEVRSWAYHDALPEVIERIIEYSTARGAISTGLDGAGIEAAEVSLVYTREDDR